MAQHEHTQADYGTGEKKLGIYLAGLISCTFLTLLSFWAVMSGKCSKLQILIIIYVSACIQLFVQLICFLRLNIQTEQGQTNVLSLVFTIIILLAIVVGSLWIMSNLNYRLY